jgi:hypothetical protein
VSAGGRYLRFLLAAAAVAAARGAVGAPLTRSAAGSDAVGAMIAALLVCWASAAIGGLPVARAARRSRQEPGQARGQGQAMLTAALAAMALRLAAVVVGAAAVALGGSVPRGPFLAWIGIGYLALLAVETWYAVGEVRRQQAEGGGGGERAEPLEAPPGRTTRMETR